MTNWTFAADTVFSRDNETGIALGIGGDFEFDFSGDTIDLTKFSVASVGAGWTLENVISMTGATVNFAEESGLTYDYDAELKKFTVTADIV